VFSTARTLLNRLACAAASERLPRAYRHGNLSSSSHRPPPL
jgi:hypothetical protein